MKRKVFERRGDSDTSTYPRSQRCGFLRFCLEHDSTLLPRLLNLQWQGRDSQTSLMMADAGVAAVAAVPIEPIPGISCNAFRVSSHLFGV